MNANVEFLNYIYQNSQMGVDTLEQLMDITEDEKLQAQLEKQLKTVLAQAKDEVSELMSAAAEKLVLSSTSEAYDQFLNTAEERGDHD